MIVKVAQTKGQVRISATDELYIHANLKRGDVFWLESDSIFSNIDLKVQSGSFTMSRDNKFLIFRGYLFPERSRFGVAKRDGKPLSVEEMAYKELLPSESFAKFLENLPLTGSPFYLYPHGEPKWVEVELPILKGDKQ